MRAVPSFVASAVVLPALLVACVAREHLDARQAPPVPAVGGATTSIAASSGTTSIVASTGAATSVTGSSPPVATGVSGTLLPSSAPAGGLNTSVIVISNLPTTTFSLEATNPTAVPLSDIVVNAPSAPTSPLASIPTPGTVPSYLPNAPPIPDGAFYL